MKDVFEIDEETSAPVHLSHPIREGFLFMLGVTLFVILAGAVTAPLWFMP